MDALLICLVQLKQGATYNIASKAFGCNSMKMRRLVDGFVEKVGVAIYEHFLVGNSMINY